MNSNSSGLVFLRCIKEQNGSVSGYLEYRDTVYGRNKRFSKNLDG